MRIIFYFMLLVSVISTNLKAEGMLYRFDSAVTMSSTNTPWDYIKLEEGGSRLFMARVADGLTVFDVDQQKVISTLDNSIGANGPLLLPAYNRLYVAMADGSLLAVEFDSLKTLSRQPLSDSVGLNSAVYDPHTHKIYAITGTQDTQSTWYIVEPQSGSLLGEKTFPFAKMDDPATDGAGVFFAPARHDKLILVLDAESDFTELSRWSTPCNVSKVLYDSATKHLFAACIGEAPLLLVYDSTSGKELARFPIGPIMDALVFDRLNKRIVTANGGDSTLSVIQQLDTGKYEFLGTVATRPGARMMQVDQRNGQLYLVYAEFTRFATEHGGVGSAKIFHANSFTVVSYSKD